MYRPSIVLWCHVLLLVASSSDSLGNSTNNDEQRDNLTVRHDLFVNSMKDRDDEMQYNSHINSNDRKNLTRLYEDRAKSYYNTHIMKIHKGKSQMSMESRVNSTKINDENNSTLQAFNENLTKTDKENNSPISYELNRKFNTDDYNNTMVTIIPYEACGNETCIQLCCPYGDRLSSENKCVAGQDNYSFPDVYQNNSENKKLNELFQLTVHDPCVLQGSAHRILIPDEYSFLVNGSLYQNSGKLVSSTSYCLGVSDRNIYDVIVCLNPIGFPTYISVYLLVTLPFLVLTFVVYSILPELKNIHSYTLRVQIALLFITNVVIYCIHAIPELSEWKYCMPLSYIFNFSMVAGCFWLNAMCIDIWWTFRKLNLQQTHGRKKKKKFLIYSIYAWGATFIVTAVCAIMDHAPGIPEGLIRPEMCKNKFWFGEVDAFTAYYYGPTGVIFTSNYCFFIATALAILYHNKHTAHQLRDSESRRYDKKKRKFCMYLKLFIVMGVSWSLGVILWFINASSPLPQFVWNISYTIDISRAIVIFIVYVCKKKILHLLVKRFGWQNRGPFGNLSINTHSTSSSNMSHHSSSMSGTISMKNINPSTNPQTSHYVEFNATQQENS